MEQTTTLGQLTPAMYCLYTAGTIVLWGGCVNIAAATIASILGITALTTGLSLLALLGGSLLCGGLLALINKMIGLNPVQGLSMSFLTGGLYTVIFVSTLTIIALTGVTTIFFPWTLIFLFFVNLMTILAAFGLKDVFFA